MGNIVSNFGSRFKAPKLTGFIMMGIRKLLDFLWQLLRLSSGLIVGFVVFGLFLSASDSRPWSARSGSKPASMVCGKISGVVYRFPRRYIIYWPEYEGASSWEPEFVNNTKGCDANIRSLWMAMAWPAMQPVPFEVATAFSFDGVSVAIEPWPYGEPGLRKLLGNYLRKTPPEVVGQAEYDNGSGLFFIKGVDSAFPDQPEGFFWLEKNGRMQYAGYCNWVVRLDNYSRCYLKLLISRDKAMVTVEFLWEKLAESKDIALSVENFLVSGIVGGVNDDKD